MRATGSPRRKAAARSPLSIRVLPVICTVLICYVPLVWIKIYERLDYSTTSCSLAIGCPCHEDGLPGKSEGLSEAQGQSSPEESGLKQDYEADEVYKPDSEGDLLRSEHNMTWDEYVQDALQLSLSPSCKYFVPGRLKAKTKASKMEVHPKQHAADDYTEVCNEMETTCKLDASCREYYAGQLASSICQGVKGKGKKSLQGCKIYYDMDMKNTTVPLHCQSCVQSARLQDATCRRRHRKCEEASTKCYQAKHGSKVRKE